MTYKNKDLKYLLTSEFDEGRKQEETWYARNIEGYAKEEDGSEIEIPKGYRLLPLGVEVPHIHMYCSKTSDTKYDWCSQYAWQGPTRTISTMTPIFAMISGWVRAYAVTEEYYEELMKSREYIPANEIIERLKVV